MPDGERKVDIILTADELKDAVKEYVGRKWGLKLLAVQFGMHLGVIAARVKVEK